MSRKPNPRTCNDQALWEEHFRDLKRDRRRTWLISLAIGVGLALALLGAIGMWLIAKAAK